MLLEKATAVALALLGIAKLFPLKKKVLARL